MTSYYERECLYRAALAIEPFGDIVDLGSWLGSLTAALASGLAANARVTPATVRIHAYDTFIWCDWMNPIGQRLGISGVADGESFLPVFNRETAKWKQWIEVHAGDVSSFPWKGNAISILVIDAMKDEATAKFIVTNFFPSLVAGKSLIFQQDFAHFYTSWIHLIWWRIRDYLELIEDLPESGGSIYRYSAAIPADRYSAILDFDSATDEEWDAAFANSRGLVRREKVHMVAAAEVMRLVHAHRGRDAANKAMWHRQHGSFGAEMELVMKTSEWAQRAAEYYR